MDVKDVSYLTDYIDILTKQKHALRKGLNRKGEVPKYRLPRAKIIFDHMANYYNGIASPASNQILFHSTLVAAAYAPSTASLSILKPINIADLALETHHRGRYMLLRSVTPPVRMTAIMVIVEDQKMDAITLQIYHQEEQMERAAVDIFPEGAVCIIKEPYFKLMADGKYGLRVDHVTDIQWLSLQDERLPLLWQVTRSEYRKTADEWKLEGNLLFEAGKYSAALEKYNISVQSRGTTEETQTILLNRSLANLKLRRYDDALSDAKSVLQCESSSEKGLFRAARALYELRRYTESMAKLEKLVAEHPNNTTAQIELSRARHRCHEEKTGIYDINSMYKATSNVPPILDHATYIGPIKVAKSGYSGRGTFATRDIKAGTLLLCEKAFAYSFGGNKTNITLLIDTQSDQMVMGTMGTLIRDVVQQCVRVPSSLPKIYDLHHEPFQVPVTNFVDGTPVVDTFLIKQIISLNCFGAPLTSRSISATMRTNFQPAKEEKDEGFDTSGVWLQASYLNHSCVSNVRRSFIGDLLFIRATCDILAGTEVVFPYVPPAAAKDYHERTSKLKKWGFSCTCVLCLDEKRTTKQEDKRREGLFDDLKAAMMGTGDVQVEKAERILSAISKTYRDSPTNVPRLRVFDAYLFLGRLCASQYAHVRTIELVVKALTALGYVIDKPDLTQETTGAIFKVRVWGQLSRYVVEAFIHLAKAYKTVAPPSQAAAKDSARLAYSMVNGEDTTFEEFCEPFLW